MKTVESRAALVYGQMTEPPGRASASACALTVAEYSVCEHKDVLRSSQNFPLHAAVSEVSALSAAAVRRRYQPTCFPRLASCRSQHPTQTGRSPRCRRSTCPRRLPARRRRALRPPRATTNLSRRSPSSASTLLSIRSPRPRDPRPRILGDEPTASPRGKQPSRYQDLRTFAIPDRRALGRTTDGTRARSCTLPVSSFFVAEQFHRHQGQYVPIAAPSSAPGDRRRQARQRRAGFTWSAPSKAVGKAKAMKAACDIPSHWFRAAPFRGRSRARVS